MKSEFHLTASVSGSWYFDASSLSHYLGQLSRMKPLLLLLLITKTCKNVWCRTLLMTQRDPNSLHNQQCLFICSLVSWRKNTRIIIELQFYDNTVTETTSQHALRWNLIRWQGGDHITHTMGDISMQCSGDNPEVLLMHSGLIEAAGAVQQGRVSHQRSLAGCTEDAKHSWLTSYDHYVFRVKLICSEDPSSSSSSCIVHCMYCRLHVYPLIYLEDAAYSSW